MRPTVMIMGARGSVPVSGGEFARYGGATTCIFLRLAGESILVDAGTGMLNLPAVLEPAERKLTVLLSHPHADHLMGFPMCPCVFDPSKEITVYAAVKNGNTPEEQLCSLMAPPLWPVGPRQLPAKIHFSELSEKLILGEVTVETMEGVHPGGVTLFRFIGDGKRIVVVTDCTLTEQLLPELTEFARNCDLLLCDGQYSQQEWKGREHFGHSTWIAAAQLGAACGAKQVRIIHHDPFRSDAQLDNAAQELAAIHGNCTFARAGEEICL